MVRRRKIAAVEGIAPEPEVAPAKRARRARRMSKAMTDSVVALAGLPFLVLRPDWALSETEAEALSLSLLDLAKANRYVNSFIHNIFTIQASGSFPLVVGAVAAKRLAWAGKLPDAVLLPADVVIGGVAARGARAGDRPDRKRQDSTIERDTEEPAPVPSSADGKA